RPMCRATPPQTGSRPGRRPGSEAMTTDRRAGVIGGSLMFNVGPQHITLTGFMATGKSGVAELVAQKLGWTAVSGDALLTERHGASPDALIARRGEAAFRRLEAELYAELAPRERTVVASGGGSLVLDETRRAFA